MPRETSKVLETSCVWPVEACNWPSKTLVRFQCEASPWENFLRLARRSMQLAIKDFGAFPVRSLPVGKENFLRLARRSSKLITAH